MSTAGLSLYHSTLLHAAGRPPLEGLLFWHVADLPLLTCCTCSLLLNRGVGGADNVLDDCKTWSTEFVAVVDILHMLASAQQGGLITFLTTVRHGHGTCCPR